MIKILSKKTIFKNLVPPNSNHFVKYCSQTKYVKIGDVTAKVRKPLDLSRVPIVQHPILNTQEALQHLKWMLSKDYLEQDIIIVGKPSPFKRMLALKFCEITGREAELLTLTRFLT